MASPAKKRACAHVHDALAGGSDRLHGQDADVFYFAYGDEVDEASECGSEGMKIKESMGGTRRVRDRTSRAVRSCW